MKAMAGLVSGLGWGAACCGTVVLAVWLDAGGGLLPLLNSAGEWVFANLRYSVVPFAVLMAVYWLQLSRLRHMLARSSDIHQVLALDHWLDMIAGLFFGVGVIWTAIGMRSALLAALGNLDADIAQSMSAFALLQRLVDGGILLALSTTIVGGIGGYGLRVIKSLVVGAALKQAYLQYQQQHQTEVINLLNTLVNQQRDQASAGSSSSQKEQGHVA